MIQEKVEWFLEQHFNMFHADLINRAIYDDSVSLEDFINGCRLIMETECGDDDEFVPSEFMGV
jgi:hypothetical protein